MYLVEGTLKIKYKEIIMIPDTSAYPITTCGIYITRKCNLSCKHCSVRKPDVPCNEMRLSDWQRAFRILKSRGIEKVSILGGEATVYEGLRDLVRYNSESVGLDLAVVSNSMSDDEIYINLVKAGLTRFSSSIDVVAGDSFDSCSAAKSRRAWEVLKLMKEVGVPHLTGYCVLRPENADQIERILGLLSAQGIWMYILPFHASVGDHWQTRGRNLPKAFEDEDKSMLEDFCSRMIALKEGGALLSNTVEYLQFLPEFAINLDWHCAPVISELRIDADGVLMSCNDIKGEHLSRYTVFSLEDDDNITKILEARAKDSANCSGCYWPSHYHAEQLRYRQSGEHWIWQND